METLLLVITKIDTVVKDATNKGYLIVYLSFEYFPPFCHMFHSFGTPKAGKIHNRLKGSYNKFIIYAAAW